MGLVSAGVGEQAQCEGEATFSMGEGASKFPFRMGAGGSSQQGSGFGQKSRAWPPGAPENRPHYVQTPGPGAGLGPPLRSVNTCRRNE